MEVAHLPVHDPVMERIVWLGAMPAATELIPAVHPSPPFAAAETRRNELRAQRQLLEREDTIKYAVALAWDASTARASHLPAGAGLAANSRWASSKGTHPTLAMSG